MSIADVRLGALKRPIARTMPRAGACLCGRELDGSVRTGWDAVQQRIVCRPCLDAGQVARDAAAEVVLTAHLDDALGDRVVLLRNRCRPDAQVGVIAVAPAGVFVIDPKLFEGQRVRADRSGEEFLVDGHQCEQIADAMRHQIEVVTEAVQSGPVGAYVEGAHCMIGASLPLGHLEVDGVVATSLRGVVRMLRASGPLDHDARRDLAEHLQRELVAA